MLNLHVIIASTRPGRAGLPIGTWFHQAARAHGKFEVRLVDLAEQNLPLLDEPEHPRFRKYTRDHTKRWSELVAAADAFVAVTPEYNFSPPATLINAFDFLFHEWAYKPLGLVSYGGMSGGVRSAQALKLVATSLKMMPMLEAVAVPFFAKQLQDGVFTPNDLQQQSTTTLLDELHRWATALKTLR